MGGERRILSFLDVPHLENPLKQRQAEAIQAVMVPLLMADLFYLVVSALRLPGSASGTLFAAVGGGLLTIGLLAARRGWPYEAGFAVVLVLWLIATTDLLVGGGVSAPGHQVYLLAILISAFILSVRTALIVTVLSLATTGVIVWLETTGRLPESSIARTPLSYWWAQIAVLVAASGMVWVTLREIQRGGDDAQRSETLHRLVADSVDDFIWSLSADAQFTYASPAVERILGYTPEEMLERRALQEQLLPGSPNVGELVAEAISEGRTTVRYEAQQMRKDGTPIWCEFSVRLILDENGDFEGITGVTRDISERKRAEARQKELEEQFRQSQKMEAVGQLAGGIAHDFNNYLTVILGNAEILALDSTGDSEKGSPLLEIQDAADRSAELTHQLLAFSRKQVLQPVVLDLNRVIRDADRLLRRVLGEDISIETICAEPLGRVEVDPSQLEQVLLNLAVNARAAMPDGGDLTIETGNVFLDNEYAARRVEVAPGEYVMLAVSDSGIGMDEDTRRQIFEPFFTTKDTGSGLGLSTVHGIVTQSGGAIGVYSEPGDGTTFRIYLPRVDSELGERSGEMDLVLAEEERGSETVLVVEDAEMVRRLIQRMLEARGYRVLTAGDRDEAIAVAEAEAEQGRIDLLLTDIVLPGTNGVRLAGELEERFGMPVLYMSGFTENGIVHRGILDPDHLLLQKPFTAKQLLKKIREALQS